MFYLTFAIAYEQAEHYHRSADTYQLIKPLQLDHGFTASETCGKTRVLELVGMPRRFSCLASFGGGCLQGADSFNAVLFALPSRRWIKFEEKVEQGGERWSKPHVATLSLHSLFELRTCIEKGSIMLDMEASSLPQVVGK